MRRSVYCTASLLVCLELKPNSYDYRTRLPSISKLQHYPPEGAEMLTRVDPSLYRSMILFQYIVKILHRSILAVLR